ncbi:adenine nucleotide translocase lysine N-methyltransferase isoform X2 [Tachysurus fulvidraco]|uniref:adenine nucleotide translocase lysine N-methyltransferase isoform X2 n=1 Tax=Tachysurus fulvidraco TaxID=1234273 RepID=UPI001FEFAAFA|nr:adenine nucleotide translocase lysine N-methyltransferase isoform X2 [Tachysurus fulvidraco]
MEDETQEEILSQFKEKRFGGWGLLQLTAGTGLAVYAMWAGILMPGFRRVPLKLQVLEASRQGFSPAVGYELNPWLLRLSRFHAWRTGHYGKVSYQREDLWKVNLSSYENITVFLAPSVLEPLQKKLLAELHEDAVIVAGRFPFPNWTPCRTEGDGMDRAWAYHIKALRKHHLPPKVISSAEHTS